MTMEWVLKFKSRDEKRRFARFTTKCDWGSGYGAPYSLGECIAAAFLWVLQQFHLYIQQSRPNPFTCVTSSPSSSSSCASTATASDGHQWLGDLPSPLRSLIIGYIGYGCAADSPLEALEKVRTMDDVETLIVLLETLSNDMASTTAEIRTRSAQLMQDVLNTCVLPRLWMWLHETVGKAARIAGKKTAVTQLKLTDRATWPVEMRTESKQGVMVDLADPNAFFDTYGSDDDEGDEEEEKKDENEGKKRKFTSSDSASFSSYKKQKKNEPESPIVAMDPMVVGHIYIPIGMGEWLDCFAELLHWHRAWSKVVKGGGSAAYVTAPYRLLPRILPHFEGLQRALKQVIRRGAWWPPQDTLAFAQFVVFFELQIRATVTHWGLEKWLKMWKTSLVAYNSIDGISVG